MSSLQQRLAELGATGEVDVTTMKALGGHSTPTNPGGHGHVSPHDDTKRRVSLG